MKDSISVCEREGGADGFISTASGSAIEAWLKEQVGRYAADEIAGSLSSFAESVAVLDMLEVDASWRGCGFGKQFLAAFIENAIDCGADGILLVADTYQAQSKGFDLVEFYRDNGFVEICDCHSGPLMAYPAQFAAEIKDADLMPSFSMAI